MKNLKSFLTENLALILLLICTIVSRLIIYKDMSTSGLSNFTPVGAMALFGGVYFRKYRSFLFPLLILWISDILMNRFVYYGEWRLFYEQFYWTYGAFALMVQMGKYSMKKVSAGNFVLSVLTITFIHWIVTDLGVWLEGTLYPKTIYGFGLCLTAAIPYELSFLLGAVVYGAALFGTMEFAGRRYFGLEWAKSKHYPS